VRPILESARQPRISAVVWPDRSASSGGGLEVIVVSVSS